MSLADEYFFAAHDPGTGKLRVHTRAVGVGLAGALLGELVLNQNLHIRSGTVVADGPPPEDEMGFRTFRQLAAESQHRALRTWMAYLAQGAYDRVAVHLMHTRQIEAIKSRRVFGTQVRYLPTDTQEAIWPADRLYGRVNRGEQLDFPDAMLAGLIVVTGLTRHVWLDGDAITLRRITASLASLPISLRELLSHAEAAVGEITLSPHR